MGTIKETDDTIEFLHDQIKEFKIENAALHIELNKALSGKNDEKLSQIERTKDKNICKESTNLEVFNAIGPAYYACDISKHKDSDFIYINFIPIVSGNLSLAMTEKSFIKLLEVIEVFKTKYVNTRQFEE